MKPAEKIPELIRDWGDIAAQALIERLSLADGKAAELGQEIALLIAESSAGSNLYIPTCLAYKASRRDEEIWSAYNAAAGRNVDELCHKHKLSFVQIHRIVRRMRYLDRASRQPSLFPDDPPPSS